MFLIWVLASHFRAVLHWELRRANSMRTCALPLCWEGLRFIRSMSTIPLLLRMYGGWLAPIAVELVDRMAILVVLRRFRGMGVIDSRSLRSGSYVRLQYFVRRRSTSLPLRRFWGMCGEIIRATSFRCSSWYVGFLSSRRFLGGQCRCCGTPSCSSGLGMWGLFAPSAFCLFRGATAVSFKTIY
jgi:hypothetical protein